VVRRRKGVTSLAAEKKAWERGRASRGKRKTVISKGKKREGDQGKGSIIGRSQQHFLKTG